MKPKFSIFTYGCQMNKYDSELITGLLINEEGYDLTFNFKEADVIVVNTCSVRQHAEDRAFSKIGILEKYKKPGTILCVVGCAAQRLKDKLFKFKGVDIVIGPSKIHEITELIKGYNKNKILALNEDHNMPYKISADKICRSDSFKAYVAVSSGCDRNCSYCIVPYTRGRNTDRPPEEIIEEIKYLSDRGYKEVCLLGQSIGSYGKRTPMPFHLLLEEINKIDGALSRIRFVTMHPTELSDEVIDKIKNLDKVCESIHLPFQAGSNEILKRMKRGYTIEYYKDRINKLREAVKDISITTDVIVGFPGEDEKAYQATLQVLEEIKFDEAFLFKYSARPNTPAYELGETVSEQIKKSRLNEVIALQNKISQEVNKKFINKTLEVLVEGENKKDDELNLLGRTRNNKIVFFKGDKDLIGKEVYVNIEEAYPHSLKGKII